MRQASAAGDAAGPLLGTSHGVSLRVADDSDKSFIAPPSVMAPLPPLPPLAPPPLPFSHASPTRTPQASGANGVDERSGFPLESTLGEPQPLFNVSESSLLASFFESLDQEFFPNLASNSASSSARGSPAARATSTTSDTVNSLPAAPVTVPRPTQEIQSQDIQQPVNDHQRRTTVREYLAQMSQLHRVAYKFNARALGLRAGSGTGIEDEDIDDRSDNEEDLSLCFNEEEESRRRRNVQRRARNRARSDQIGKKKGRGRGGSAGGSESKGVVLFKTVDLMYWLQERNKKLQQEIEALERELG